MLLWCGIIDTSVDNSYVLIKIINKEELNKKLPENKLKKIVEAELKNISIDR